MDFENAVLARSGTEGKMSQMMQQRGEGGNDRVKVTISSSCLKRDDDVENESQYS